KPLTIMKRKTLIAQLAGWLIVATAPAQTGTSAASTEALRSSISGYVSNAVSSDLLEGAKVEISPLGLLAITDGTGQYTLTDVPTGSHELTVSYLGLETIRAQVVVPAGHRVVKNFDLTSSVYQMHAFK